MSNTDTSRVLLLLALGISRNAVSLCFSLCSSFPSVLYRDTLISVTNSTVIIKTFVIIEKCMINVFHFVFWSSCFSKFNVVNIHLRYIYGLLPYLSFYD